MSKATFPYGSRLQFGDEATTEVWTTISELTSIAPPQATRDIAEVTNFDSASGEKEKVVGWIDNGAIDWEANWTGDATQDHLTGVMKKFKDGLRIHWRIVRPKSTATATDGFAYTFFGSLTKCVPSTLTPGAPTKLSGSIVLSSGAGYGLPPTS